MKGGGGTYDLEETRDTRTFIRLNYFCFPGLNWTALLRDCQIVCCWETVQSNLLIPLDFFYISSQTILHNSVASKSVEKLVLLSREKEMGRVKKASKMFGRVSICLSPDNVFFSFFQVLI